MKVETVSVANNSDLFNGYLHVWEALCNNDPDFSWGDNDRTLISIERMQRALDDIDTDDVAIDDIDAVSARLSQFDKPDIYIDLER